MKSLKDKIHYFYNKKYHLITYQRMSAEDYERRSYTYPYDFKVIGNSNIKE